MARIAFLSERMLRGFGVDLVIDAMARQLVGRGHDVTVYASVVEGRGDRPYRLDRVPTRASRFPLRYQGAARPWASYIDAHRHDVLFIESFPFFSLIPHLRTPVVVVDHGVSPSLGMPLWQKSAFAYIRATQQRLYFPRAAALITISNFVRSLLPSMLARRATVVYNGCDHYPLANPSDPEALRSRLRIGSDEVVALYVGRLNPEGQPYKGTQDLIDAAERWRAARSGIRLIMAGHGSQDDAARIRRSGAIPLLGTPAGEMPALFAAADIYLTASRWEGFDLPIMEAAFQGVPAVALNAGAHPEVIADNETGVLAPNLNVLFQEAEGLANDPVRRRAMGEAARARAAAFNWSAAAGDYEKVMNEAIKNAPRVRRPAAVSKTIGSLEPSAGNSSSRSDVTAVILNYGAPYEVLQRCISSVSSQTCALEVLLVDNGSTRNRVALEELARDFPSLRMLSLERNYGFAGGMNRGIAATSTEFVLLLNNDIVLEPSALEEMLRVIDQGEDVVGVAPKIMLERSPGYIDAIGNLIDPSGSAYNMGIGQLDVGQYDRVERTFGACFAATLLRRSAFEAGLVGPLEERFFMYYEDVDWCFRAGILGLKFLTAPRAVIHHAHSLSTRELDYAYKYRLIMRNFFWTAARDFSRGRALRVCLRRILGMSRGMMRGPYRRANLLILVQALWGLPAFVWQRRGIQGRRRARDEELFSFSHGERGFFDPISYQPIRSLEALASVYFRRFLLSGEEADRRIAEAASGLAASRLRFDRTLVRERLSPLLRCESAAVQEFVESLEA